MLKQVYDDWNTSRKAHEAIQQYNEFLDQYYKTLAEDTYGGKTPQETLDMFIDALERGDIDLASKYFALDDNLSRKQGEDGLQKAKEEGRISYIIQQLKKAVPAKNYNEADGFVWFNVYNDAGELTHEMELMWNEYSGVWKIESM